ncbi:hypothetical protein DICPUDRAFT_151658 [Dictyostelium purpureum]|uniref:Ubiquitin-like domain-containing protein n=1 Tax=Dictyostelium purpureum TaxID=5786 RepID=F0ZJF1_DICPU|nr:uncharacterized protein DICPUDRAFT_151658 [Dictyostelium purpureum]EGC35909.1 hypothetical protein DICPUDRAFT_151658 [Dictyostelium purpureum]|eukprot:XP_003287563.1 hypothetical protein DICPUDRAFT_151658 [Dictyostelium purpureum]
MVDFKVKVGTFSHGIITVLVSTEDTIASLKDRLVAPTGIPLDQQIIFMNGVALVNSKTLGFYRINVNSILILTVRL